MSNPGEDSFSRGAINYVVRIGDTVRRPTGPWTPTIHALLRHLHTAGLQGIPQVRGVDNEGREILSLLPGTAAHWPLPSALRRQTGLVQYGNWLRDFHDAVATFEVPSGAIWRGWNPATEGEIVRHGDLGAWNTVWNEEGFVGVIDWDSAHPGSAQEDVSQALWHAVPLYDDSTLLEAGFLTAPNRLERANVFMAAYGGRSFETERQLATEVLAFAVEEQRHIDLLAGANQEPWASLNRRPNHRAGQAVKRRWLEEVAPR